MCVRLLPMKSHGTHTFSGGLFLYGVSCLLVSQIHLMAWGIIPAVSVPSGQQPPFVGYLVTNTFWETQRVVNARGQNITLYWDSSYVFSHPRYRNFGQYGVNRASAYWNANNANPAMQFPLGFSAGYQEWHTNDIADYPNLGVYGFVGFFKNGNPIPIYSWVLRSSETVYPFFCDCITSNAFAPQTTSRRYLTNYLTHQFSGATYSNDTGFLAARFDYQQFGFYAKGTNHPTLPTNVFVLFNSNNFVTLRGYNVVNRYSACVDFGNEDIRVMPNTTLISSETNLTEENFYPTVDDIQQPYRLLNGTTVGAYPEISTRSNLSFPSKLIYLPPWTYQPTYYFP